MKKHSTDYQNAINNAQGIKEKTERITTELTNANVSYIELQENVQFLTIWSFNKQHLT
jgi:hypothetical protein